MEKTRSAIDRYIPEIEKIFGKNLVSINLFGSIARGDYVNGKSDINLLIIRKNRLPAELLQLSRLTVSLKRRMNFALPLVLTEEEMRRSGDVFPMEYRDMKDFHIVLKGKDVLKDLKIEDKHLRLELESQIKGKLILLRESMIQWGKNKKVLKKILLKALPSVIVILRHIFILNKKPVPKDIYAICQGTEEMIKNKLTFFRQLLHIKIGLLKLKDKDIVDLYMKTISEIERLSDYIDRFKIRKR
ncbi:MAG: nucleotidyltransferase domain-containing protein [Spirochaetes bacterium]|nr:nucleotidyltransferase domain-containing protein [Spirochaetota bacterium]